MIMLFGMTDIQQLSQVSQTLPDIPSDYSKYIKTSVLRYLLVSENIYQMYFHFCSLGLCWMFAAALRLWKPHQFESAENLFTDWSYFTWGGPAGGGSLTTWPNKCRSGTKGKWTWRQSQTLIWEIDSLCSTSPRCILPVTLQDDRHLHRPSQTLNVFYVSLCDTDRTKYQTISILNWWTHVCLFYFLAMMTKTQVQRLNTNELKESKLKSNVKIRWFSLCSIEV